MAKCIECGNWIEKTDKFCGECGRSCVEYGIISECGEYMLSVDKSWVPIYKTGKTHKDTLTFSTQRYAQLYFNFNTEINGCVVACVLQGTQLECY